MYEFRSFSPARIIICCLYLNLDNRKSTAALSVRSVGQRRSLVFNLILTSASMFSRCKWWEEVSQASRRQRSGSSCIRDMVRYCERKHQSKHCSAPVRSPSLPDAPHANAGRKCHTRSGSSSCVRDIVRSYCEYKEYLPVCTQYQCL